MEYISCNLCGSDRTALMFRRSDTRFLVSDEAFAVVKCLACSLVYVNPRPEEKEIRKYYTDEFYQAELSPEQALEGNRGRIEAMYRHVQHLPAGRLLDIGCYKGEFLYFMKNKGWTVSGLEFYSRPPNLFGLNIHYGEIDSASFEPSSLDLVTMWAVLEHVYDPKRLLAQVRQLLKPTGELIILVPNFNSIPARFMRHDDVPRHTTMFTRETLYSMLRVSGYKALSCMCDQGVYSGSVRGVLNYMVKCCGGESVEEIVAQNRRPERWHEFSRQLRGKESPFIGRIDLWDQFLTPYLDAVLDRLGLGFIMTVRAIPV
ncbi:MAG: class I SAM-dependent methyltransferase [Nitrospira sp.]|nr:class I SAM-dependent methyltransferase [Nitrospira sp.]